MPSRVREFSGDAIQKRLQKGHGMGEGPHYKPFFFVSEIPSDGTSAVIKGPPFDRDRHFPSQLEVRYYFAVAWSDQLVDFREQYPLLPIEDTLQIAKALGFKHPADNKRNPVVMTTDAFLIVNRNGKLYQIVRTVKTTADLCSTRTLEKLEIERQYFLFHGIEDWGVVTDLELQKFRKEIDGLKSLNDVRSLRCLAPLQMDRIKAIATSLSTRVKAAGYVRLPSLCSDLDQKFGVETGVCLTVARFLIANKAWHVDLSLLGDLTQPIAIQIRNLEAVWGH